MNLSFCFIIVAFGRQDMQGFSLGIVSIYGIGKSESLLNVEVKLKNPGSDKKRRNGGDLGFKILKIKCFH